MKRICVFCGSSPGNNPGYSSAVRLLGKALVDNGMGLVYGGAGVGLMGELAKTVIKKKGEVIGVIPQQLAEKEVAFKELADLRIVKSMHERKALMAELSDGFIALPGGLGTVEEFFEILTWSQLGIHQKPCGLLNVLNYYDQLIAFINHAINENFLQEEFRALFFVEKAPHILLKKFENYKPRKIDKAGWALRMRT